jgi:DNA gyrase/topoisomerase IV subunit A
LLIDTAGKIIRLSPTEIRTMGRQAKGVRLIKLDEDQILSTIAAFKEHAEEQGQNDGSKPSEKPRLKADEPGDDFFDFYQFMPNQEVDLKPEPLISEEERPQEDTTIDLQDDDDQSYIF